jgi:plasmid stabilization system protein ParE
MDQFNVIWVDSAKNELLEIIEYIALENQSNAKKIYQNIKNKADSLSTMPYKGRIIPEFKQFDINLYREVIESPWRIMYRIQDKTVVIMTILDGRRDVEDILFKKIISFNGKTFV